jgi:hypothetical protein
MLMQYVPKHFCFESPNRHILFEHVFFWYWEYVCKQDADVRRKQKKALVLYWYWVLEVELCMHACIAPSRVIHIKNNVLLLSYLRINADWVNVSISFPGPGN